MILIIEDEKVIAMIVDINLTQTKKFCFDASSLKITPSSYNNK